jgi:uncharacterized protein YqfA (UPF0365 family)
MAAIDLGGTLGIVVGLFFLLTLALILFISVKYGALWLQAHLSGAKVRMVSLIGMSFRQVSPSMIVNAKIMLEQAGLNVQRKQGVSTAGLEAQYLAGGDVMHVVLAIIAAHRAGINLDFDRAAAIDLAGRDVLDAVRTSVSPKVIDCPDPTGTGKTRLSAVAKNGVELLIHARVTVRTNLDQLIGGATEETIIARVGQGIIAAIGSAESHMEVLETPDRISKGVLKRGLDANTAFEIVSIDIADIEVGENIGARLMIDQANADMLTSQAFAEIRRMEALASQQEMKALVAESRSNLVQAQSYIPTGMAAAIRAGRFTDNRQFSIEADRILDTARPRNLPQSKTKSGAAGNLPAANSI